MSRITILGAGAWGTAIALALSRRGGHDITLWSHSQDEADTIAGAGENILFLPGFPLPRSIRITANDAAVSSSRDRRLRHPFRIPALHHSSPPSIFPPRTDRRLRHQGHRERNLPAHDRGHLLGIGRLQPTHAAVRSAPRPSPTHGNEVFTESAAPEVTSAGNQAPPAWLDCLSLSFGALSGPTFALEVAQGQPTAITVAFSDPAIAARVQNEFSSETLRLYTSTDVTGVELGGALKNVIAIAAGVAAGMDLGFNSAAALITRGIAEITRLAVACGGHRETLAGLSGVGDLVLTCTGSLSRNRTVGSALGQGRKLPEILASLGGKVAEGVHTTRAALQSGPPPKH